MARGRARSWTGNTSSADGRWALRERDSADFATRVALRAPIDPGDVSGTWVVEWRNVSPGADAAPDWTGPTSPTGWSAAGTPGPGSRRSTSA